jgi:hypothetical protein
MVPKPEILPLNRNYVCTDARTVLAFILCTVDYKPWRVSRPGIPWSPEHLRFDGTHIRIKQLEEGTVVAHLEGSFKNNLTKGDIEGLLAGYPPWYRELVRMPHGPSVPHPIISQIAEKCIANLLLDDLAILPISAVDSTGAVNVSEILGKYKLLKNVQPRIHRFIFSD